MRCSRTRRSARHRAAFAKQAAIELEASEETVKKDVGKVLLALEEQQEERIRQALEPKTKEVVLTPAEREVALLLLKGYEHKEIASLLGRSDRTIRQHAVSVYRKSNLSGRAELAAFFLEDLLLPPEG